MSLIADGLLIATCLTAAIYCFVLGQRLKKFSSMEEGVGQQIKQLNSSLNETRSALKEAQATAQSSADDLSRSIIEARKLSHRLRELVDATNLSSAAVQSMPGTASLAVNGQSVQPKSFEAAQAIEPLDQPEEELNMAEPVGVDVDEEIDLAEVDMADILSNAAGEQQLGFLPDAETDSVGHDDEHEFQTRDSELSARNEHQLGSEISATDRPASGNAANAEEQLLKVERMAL